MYVLNSARSAFNDRGCRMRAPSSIDEELPLEINDCVAILVALTTSTHDWHREVFQSALSDLLGQIRILPSVIDNVRCLLERELSVPYCPQWRVSEMEYERRKRLVFLCLRDINGAIDNALNASQFEHS